MSNFRKYAQLLTVLPLTFGSIWGGNQNFVSPYAGDYLLARHEMSLENRQPDSFVNDVFKKNILLNLAYLNGQITKLSDIKWDEITKPFKFEFKLDPGKTFAYHADIKAIYEDTLVKTTNAHFNSAEGFKTDGYLFGDGICHLASLINWVAKDAGLSVEAPTNHDFAPIPDIPKKYGVSIYFFPGSHASNSLQNLYITNNKDKPVAFRFAYQDNKVIVSVVELN